MKRTLSIYIIISVIMALAASSAFSQATPPAAESAKAETAAPAASQAKEISIYGEVQAVNAVANTLSIQYYDYDSDSEKTAEVVVVAETKMENAKSASDVKKGDWVDVTYVVSGGKNTARAVSVEKEEPATEPMAGPSTTGASSDE